MLRLRKQQVSEREPLLDKSLPNNCNINEEQWEPLMKELLRADLILTPSVVPGFKRFKEELWPKGVMLCRTNKGLWGEPQYTVYFEGKEEYNYWRKLRGKSSFVGDIWFCFF